MCGSPGICRDLCGLKVFRFYPPAGLVGVSVRNEPYELPFFELEKTRAKLASPRVIPPARPCYRPAHFDRHDVMGTVEMHLSV